MITKYIKVEQKVKVTLDETKFTPEFLKEYSEVFYKVDGLDGHFENLAKRATHNPLNPTAFEEGYGVLEDMGINVQIEDTIVVDTGRGYKS